MENTAVKKTTPLLPRTQFLPTGRRDADLIGIIATAGGKGRGKKDSGGTETT